MKFLFETEDAVVGLLFGVFLIGLSGKYFAMPWAKTALIVLIPVFVVFIILDLIAEISDIGRHPLFIGLSILHNIFDAVLCVALYAVFFEFSVPYLDPFLVHLTNEMVLYILGIFEAVSHVLWLIATPFNT